MAIQIFHGDKGGVGKSLLACAFGEYLLGKGHTVTVVESDTQNGDVARYFEKSTPVKLINLRVEDGWIELLSCLAEEERNDVIVTLPAGIGSVFATHAADLRTAAADLKRGLTIWWPMNRTPDSIALLRPVVDAFGKNSGAQLVAVRNLFFGPPDRFVRWQQSKLRKEFLDAGGLEADFPELHERIVDATFASLPARRFSSNGESGLGYGERLWLKRWLEETTAGFDGLAERVGVGKR